MADSVRYYLESMVPELEDLQRRRLLTADEVRVVIRERTRHEYRIKRRGARRLDFLRYLTYEMNLDTLRRSRQARYGVVTKVSLSDYAGVRRILFLFDRALRKFPGDVTMWRQFLDFAHRAKANKVLTRVYARAIQHHPTKPGFWIEAASWEFSGNGSMDAARVLMQRALRMNRECKKVWLEYARLELLFLEKIRLRRKVLGISNDEPETEVVDEEIEFKKSDCNLTFLQGAVPLAVYENAMKSLPQEFSLHAEFLALFQQFPDTEQIQSAVYQNISEQFHSLPEARALLAERHVAQITPENDDFATQLRLVFAEYNEAIEDCPIAEMMSKYVAFLQRLSETLRESDDVDAMAPLLSLLKEKIQSLFVYAEERQIVSEEMYISWLQLTKDAALAAQILQSSLERYPHSAKLWSHRIDLLLNQMELVPLNASILNEIHRVADLALQSTQPRSATAALWLRYLPWLEEKASLSLEELEPLYIRALDSRTGAEAELLEKYFNFLSQHQLKVTHIRQRYLKLLSTQPRTRPFFVGCSEFEKKQQDPAALRTLYDKWLQLEKNNPDLWLEVIQFELEHENVPAAMQLHWRALRALDHPTDPRPRARFVALYAALKDQ